MFDFILDCTNCFRESRVRIDRSISESIEIGEAEPDKEFNLVSDAITFLILIRDSKILTYNSDGKLLPDRLDRLRENDIMITIRSISDKKRMVIKKKRHYYLLACTNLNDFGLVFVCKRIVNLIK